MGRTDTSPYIPQSSDDSWSIELLPKKRSNANDALLGSHRELNKLKSYHASDDSVSREDEQNVLHVTDTRVQYTKSTKVSVPVRRNLSNGEIIVPVHRDGVSISGNKRLSLEEEESSDDNDWEQLAKDRGREIKLLEYRVAIMQKVISQYDRKCDMIKRIAEAANERSSAIYELGESYLERGIGHEDINSDPEDKQIENTCTYMKNA